MDYLTNFRKLLLLLLTAGAVQAADSWPEFRGPTGQGVSAATNVPISWSAQSNVAWKVEVPGAGWSSPSLSRGKIYLTTAVSDANGEISLRLLCLDAKQGKTLWNSEAIHPWPAETKAMHKKNSLASPTALVTDQKIFAHFGHLGTAALDLNGKVLWTQTDLKYSPVHGNGGSPALVGNKLVFSCDGGENPYLAALEADSGKIAWKTPRNTPASRTFSFSTALLIEVAGQKQLISPTSGFVGGYDPESGKELWRVRYGQGYSVVPRPIYENGLLYLSSGFDAPVVYAIDPKGAVGDATETNVKWTVRKGGPNTPSLVTHEGLVFFVSDAGIASCVKAQTGEVLWSERLGGGFSASPIVAEGKVYFQNEEGKGFVVQAAPEFKVLSTNDLEEKSLASYAVADGTLFIRTEKHLWKIGK